MISKWGLFFLCSASVIVLIAVFVVDFSSNPVQSVIYQVEPPPEEITCEEICSAYLANETNADGMYKDKRFFFSSIEVDDITMSERTSGGEFFFFKSSFTSDNVTFSLQDLSIMQNVEVGFIVDVVGWCRGQSRDGICITDCWIRGVSDDLGTGTQINWGY
jgi:hypothetical protein